MMPLRYALIIGLSFLTVDGVVAQTTKSQQPTVPLAQSKNRFVDVNCERNSDECRQPPGLITESGNDLHLKLTNGKTKTFTTTRKACDAFIYEKCLQYHFVLYYPQHRLFLIEVKYLLEGGTYLMVSGRTGAHVRLDAMPQFSPSRQRFAAVSATEAHGANSIEIWSTRNDPPKSEWRYEVPDDDYSLYQFDGWDGDERLNLRLTTRMGEEILEGLFLEAVRTSRGWAFTAPRARK